MKSVYKEMQRQDLVKLNDRDAQRELRRRSKKRGKRKKQSLLGDVKVPVIPSGRKPLL